MLSKNKIRFIQSLARKKIREQEKVFLVEGNKMVLEAIDAGRQLILLCGTSDFLAENNISPKMAAEVIEVSPEEMQKASLLQTPQQALAVVNMPEQHFNLTDITPDLTLALDFIQDPGNLGTIIRLADWFGIRHILCSENTVDCFNPKVIQSSMGAIFRVEVHYLDLVETLKQAAASGTEIFGTFLEGENLYKHPLSKNGILVMGNEGNGISEEVARMVTDKVHIPAFPGGQTGSESLNVATATAICCAEFRRRMMD
ncbi:MAG: TrmH family RNA methyltransferase [Mangrovibacterium sp.]